MQEPEPVPVNLHESRWARVRWGHYRVSDGEATFACEKCVFDRGEHADFCPKKQTGVIGISHGDANFMQEGR